MGTTKWISGDLLMISQVHDAINAQLALGTFSAFHELSNFSSSGCCCVHSFYLYVQLAELWSEIWNYSRNSSNLTYQGHFPVVCIFKKREANLPRLCVGKKMRISCFFFVSNEKAFFLDKNTFGQCLASIIAHQDRHNSSHLLSCRGHVHAQDHH